MRLLDYTGLQRFLVKLKTIIPTKTSNLTLTVSETSNIPSAAGTYVWLGKTYTSIVAGSNKYYVGMVKRISI